MKKRRQEEMVFLMAPFLASAGNYSQFVGCRLDCDFFAVSKMFSVYVDTEWFFILYRDFAALKKLDFFYEGMFSKISQRKTEQSRKPGEAVYNTKIQKIIISNSIGTEFETAAFVRKVHNGSEVAFLAGNQSAAVHCNA